MSARYFKEVRPLLKHQTYGEIFDLFSFPTWFFHVWPPSRNHDWEPNRWSIGICILGQCWFIDVWQDESKLKIEVPK